MSVARHHLEWQQLLDISGPWLSMPVLLRAFPDGLDKADDGSTLRARLHSAYDEWLDNQGGLSPDPAIHRAWLRFVLRELLELDDALLVEGQALPPGCTVTVAEHQERLTPKLVLLDPPGRPSAGKARMLVELVPRGQSLDAPLSGSRWKASPATRMMTLLHGAGVRLGLVTNGEQWMLVHAVPNETTTYASFYANLFLEEPLTLRALQSLLGGRRFFSVPDADTLEALLKESSGNQQEVTDQLGSQVRRAVEVLIQSIDRIDRDRGRTLLRGTDEKVLYESAVTVMMRLVFLFAAEERKLLLLGDALYDQHYAVSTLRDQLQTVADQHGSEVLQRRHDAWSRLLATFRAVHGGVTHEAMRLPAYGGSLFNPDRFPFLEGRAPGTEWRSGGASPLPIDNLTVLDVLTSLQVLQVKVPGGGGSESRRLSFRALDVEQIGHVYEGLLDHTAKRARTPVLSLRGSKKLEPEVEVAELEKLLGRGEEALVDFLVEETGRVRSTVQKAIAYQIPTEDRSRYLTVCENKGALYQRIAPWAGLIRDDVHGHPVIFDEGSVYVTEGAERRSTGTHYTPRTLTEPIVQYTLEPLVYEGPAEGWAKESWKLHSAREILALRVCDLAMGSGAFLVQACRYLGARLVEAWGDAEEAAAGRVVVTPEGDLGTGSPTERALPRDDVERLAIAQRIVADRCLYGVDKNPMAVEMAKLSLWLVTLQKDRPFTFVDHALRCGDSLLGLTDVAQLERFHLDPKRAGTIPMGVEVIRPAVKRAVELRQAIEQRVTETMEDAEAKARLLEEAREATEDLRLVGDLIVGAALSTASRGDNALDRRLQEIGPLVAEMLREKVATVQERQRQDLANRAGGMLDERRGAGHPERVPFHWAVEFPEVFEKSGFDAFVGNPPFMGGLKLETALGTDYRAYLVHFVGNDVVGNRGTGDICAYFALRISELMGRRANFGILATNTIAQGDTLRLGLEQIVGRGLTIYRATPSLPWPGEAHLEVSHLWMQAGRWAGPYMLDGCAVAGITPQLTSPGKALGRPHQLEANKLKSFQGANVVGLGFVISPAEAHALIEKSSSNAQVVHPYINGKDLNTSPDQVALRWIVDFRTWPLNRDEPSYKGPVATDFPDCLSLVEQRVRPERETYPPTSSWNRSIRARWWQFALPRVDLYEAIAGLDRVLVRARIANLHAVVWASTACVFSEKTIVFVGVPLCVMQSGVHEAWARQYSSTLRSDMQYTPSDCFDTFPFPPPTPALEPIGEHYHEHRRQLMLIRQEGLTKTYNRVNNPTETSSDIAELRALHVEMDQAVAAAYGWTDLDLGHGFHETKQGTRYTISEPARREVLDRLLELNHKRYAEEVAQGLHDTGKKPKPPKPKPEPAPLPTQAKPGQQTGFNIDMLPPIPTAPPKPYPTHRPSPPPTAPSLPKSNVTLSAPAAKLRDALASAPEPMGKSALIAAAGLADSEWLGAIRELQTTGQIEQQGEKRGTKYRWIARHR